MNNYIKAIKELDLAKVEALAEKDSKWIRYEEENGKNALHFLGAVKVGNDAEKAGKSLKIFQYLLHKGMDINAVHRIPDEQCGFFPARPLWYAYAKGRNHQLYTWLLEAGANPENCMFAIAWNDDVEAAEMFRKHGARTESDFVGETPFMAAFYWKRFKVAEWFLKNGSDVNARMPDGDTVLHVAVRKRYDIEAIRLLLRYGAGFDIKNKAGISPKEIAETNRQRKVLTLLKKS